MGQINITQFWFPRCVHSYKSDAVPWVNTRRRQTCGRTKYRLRKSSAEIINVKWFGRLNKSDRMMSEAMFIFLFGILCPLGVYKGQFVVVLLVKIILFLISLYPNDMLQGIQKLFCGVELYPLWAAILLNNNKSCKWMLICYTHSLYLKYTFQS